MRDYDGDLRRLMDAAARTEVIRAPRQLLLTFGVTTLDYYVITEPSYSEVIPGPPEAVVRQGRVAAQRPTVVTPGYMSRLDGFGDDAYRYFGDLAPPVRAQLPRASVQLLQRTGRDEHR